MIPAWRLVKEKYAPEALSGFGGRMVSGRWHHAGVPIVYAADSLALAALEIFVHLPPGAHGMKFVAVKIEIPEDLEIHAPKVPHNWRDTPSTESTRTLGTTWFHGAHTAAMKVPSVIVPVENNYLLNPSHPDFGKLIIHPPLQFSFDPRMWK